MLEGTGERAMNAPCLHICQPYSLPLSFPSQCPCHLLWDASLDHLCHSTLGNVRCASSVLTSSSLQSDTHHVDFLFIFPASTLH